MGRKLTQEEAEQKSLDVGVKLVSKYVNSRTKTGFECPKCFHEFLCKPNNIWYKTVKTCRKCSTWNRITQQEAEAKTKRIGGILIGKYNGSTINTQFKCPKCGVIFLRKPNLMFSRK